MRLVELRRCSCQLLCHSVGPSIADHVFMTHRLVHVLVLLLLVGTSINAQQRADFSIKQRAESLEPYFLDSAKHYGIDPRILRVLCYLESRFRLTAISPKGARGPMQFMPETAARYGLNNPHDPRAAIDAAARYFRDLLLRFDGRTISHLLLITQVKVQLPLFRMDVFFDCRMAKLLMPLGWLQAEFLRTARRRIMCAWRSTYFVVEGW